MIADAVIRQQIVRLSVLNNPPADPGEVEHAYRESAKNPDHAARITGWVMRHCTFFPVPKEVYEAASLTLRQDDLPRPDRKCKACDGTGYEQVWQLITYRQTGDGGVYKDVDLITDPVIARELDRKVDGKTQNIYSAGRPCTRCSYGHSISSAPPAAPDEGRGGGLQKPGPFLIPGAGKDKEVS